MEDLDQQENNVGNISDLGQLEQSKDCSFFISNNMTAKEFLESKNIFMADSIFGGPKHKMLQDILKEYAELKCKEAIALTKLYAADLALDSKMITENQLYKNIIDIKEQEVMPKFE